MMIELEPPLQNRTGRQNDKSARGHETAPRMKACYSELVLYSSLQSRCHRCQLPLCTLTAAETCTWRDLHLELECQILAEKRQVQVQNDHDDFEKDEPHPLYQCILPLRCLLIKESRPEHWAAIQVSIQSYTNQIRLDQILEF